MEKIVLIGCGGHAKSVVDSIEAQGKYEIIGFIAEKIDNDFEYRSYRIIGTDADLVALYDRGIKNAAVCIGYMGKGNVRKKLYDTLKRIGYTLPVIIDPTSTLAKDVLIEEGTFIGKNSIINSNVNVGKMVIVNTGAIIEHDCIIDDYTHIAVNAAICGCSQIGQSCLIGAGATVIQEVKIGDNTMLGAGSVATGDIEAMQIAVGVPAKSIKIGFNYRG